MDRRLVLPLVGAACGAVGFGLAALLQGPPEPTPAPPPEAVATPPSDQVVPGDAPPPTRSAVWLVQRLPDGLRPLDPQSPEEQAALSLVYDWVYYRSAPQENDADEADADGAWRSRVVQRWTEQEDGTGRWVELALRPDLAWHDGQPVTAGDLCFTVIERAVRTALHGPRRCAVKDTHTARVQLAAIDGDPRAALAFPLLPAHLREQLAPADRPEEIHRQPVGSGPYRAQVGRRTLRLQWAGVPHHAPALASIDWMEAGDPEVAWRTMLAGGADAVFGLSLPFEAEVLAAGGAFTDGGPLGRIAWLDPDDALTPGPDAPLADLDGAEPPGG